MIPEGIREIGEGVTKEISCKFSPNGKRYGLRDYGQHSRRIHTQVGGHRVQLQGIKAMGKVLSYTRPKEWTEDKGSKSSVFLKAAGKWVLLFSQALSPLHSDHQRSTQSSKTPKYANEVKEPQQGNKGSMRDRGESPADNN